MAQAIYGSAKTGSDQTAHLLKTGNAWVAYVDLRLIKGHKCKNHKWKNGNLFPVLGTITGETSKGTDVLGKLSIGDDVKNKLTKKFQTNEQYHYLKITVFSACCLYGNAEGQKAAKSNASKFILPVDHNNDMIEKVANRLGGGSAKQSDVEKAIEKSLDTGKVGSASAVGTSNIGGGNSKSNDLIANGPKPGGKKGKNKGKGGGGGDAKWSKQTQQYEVTLSGGQTVTATISFTGPENSKVIKIGAKKIF